MTKPKCNFITCVDRATMPLYDKIVELDQCYRVACREAVVKGEYSLHSRGIWKGLTRNRKFPHSARWEKHQRVFYSEK